MSADLAIIIPTLNEAGYIGKTLEVAQGNLSGNYRVEFVLVDAGSFDGTVDLVSGKVDKIHTDPALQGRKYESLNFGANRAQSKYLLFLDADCLLPKNFDQFIMETLSQNNVVGGAFEFAMERKGGWLSLGLAFNKTRYRVSKNYFGDQGFFCKRSVFEEVGGFPKEPIMEAAFLCRLLRKKGKLKLIKHPVVSSVRRFESGGILKVLIFDLYVWIHFILGLSVRRFAAGYWEENRERGRK